MFHGLPSLRRSGILTANRRVAMYGLLGLLVLVLDIFAIVDCVKSNSDTGKIVLWVVLILFLPLLGMLLYFLVGRSKSA
jgi:hypothetical protein